MSEPFTLHIFVSDGDPEGIRVVNRMNWTGKGIVFPRSKWADVQTRDELRKSGVYILTGYSESQDDEDDRPTVYIGQTDVLCDRLQHHISNKTFWDKACLFISTSDGLNRAHITWLEWALMQHAMLAGRCHLDNGNEPSEPRLSESEKADTQAFLKEILQILPLIGFPVFEQKVLSRNPITRPIQQPPPDPLATAEDNEVLNDTVIVPAREDGFNRVFLGEHCWHAIRISGAMLSRIKYIAAYQTKPISAVTYYAEVARIEEYGDNGKYKLVFKTPAQAFVPPIPFGDCMQGAMQGPRYTTLEKLKAAKTLGDVL